MIPIYLNSRPHVLVSFDPMFPRLSPPLQAAAAAQIQGAAAAASASLHQAELQQIAAQSAADAVAAESIML